MKRKSKLPILDHHVNVRLTRADHARLKERAVQSNCRRMGEFCRWVLLDKPATLFVRDRSLDDLVTQLIATRKAMEDYRTIARDPADARTMEMTLRVLEKNIHKIYDYVRQIQHQQTPVSQRALQ